MTRELTIIEQNVPKYLSLEVKDQTTLQEASTYLISAKKEYKALKADMDKLLEPFKEGIDGVKEKYDLRLKSLKSVIDVLNDKTSGYTTRLMNEAQAKAQAISDRVGEGKGHLKPETAIKQLESIEKGDTSIETVVGSMTFRNVPQLVIEDISLIPREYLVPDEAKIKSALKLGLQVKGAKLINKQISWNSK